MQISEDFEDDKEAKFLVSERWHAGKKAYYDSVSKKIVYFDYRDADEVYRNSQIDGMQKHRWFRFQEAGEDIGELAAARDWIEQYSLNFRRFWRRTHVFVPVKK